MFSCQLLFIIIIRILVFLPSTDIFLKHGIHIWTTLERAIYI